MLSSTVWVLGITGLGALAIWLGLAQPDEVEIDVDRVVAVQRRDVLDAVTASGRVEPLARVAVMSRASGIIKEIHVDEGDVVKKGQVLAELDREQLEAQLAQDRADRASAEARVKAARARLDEAKVRLEDPEVRFAQREVDRLAELYASGDVAERELDTASLGLDNARFRVEQVRASLPVLEASVAEAEANLLAASASLERSETALRETTILCPIDGVVLVRDKEVGDGVSSILTAGGNATQILVLGDLTEMYVDARVDEVDLGRIHQGMEARITVDAFRGRTFDGRVQRIAPAGTVDSNGIVTFEVRLTIDDPDRLLRPDMTADAKLVLEDRRSVPTLPQRALARGDGDTWVVQRVVSREPPRVEPTTIEVGLSDGLVTEIVSGLDEGDEVLLPPGGTGGSLVR